MPDSAIRLLGVDQWKAVSDDLARKSARAARTFVRRAGTVEAKAIRQALRSNGKHAKGTQTPAHPGGPPASITGTLAKAPTARRPKQINAWTFEGGCRLRNTGYYGLMLEHGQYGPGGGRPAYPFFVEAIATARPLLGPLWEETMRGIF